MRKEINTLIAPTSILEYTSSPRFIRMNELPQIKTNVASISQGKNPESLMPSEK
jgi:hypothetical protein